jgi:hypothetical protein
MVDITRKVVRDAMADLNNKLKYAQQVADSTGIQQAVIKNSFGSYDIKRTEKCAVVLVSNPFLVCVVDPQIRLDKDRNMKEDVVLSVGAV